MTVGAGCRFVGERLADSNLRHRFGVNVVSIQRGQNVIPIPGGNNRLFPGDVIGVIGTDEEVEALLPAIEAELPPESGVRPEIRLTSILLSESSPLVDRTPLSSSLRDNYSAIVVAVHRGDEFIDSNPNLVFRPGDIIWAVGDVKKLNTLK